MVGSCVPVYRYRHPYTSSMEKTGGAWGYIFKVPAGGCGSAKGGLRKVGSWGMRSGGVDKDETWGGNREGDRNGGKGSRRTEGRGVHSNTLKPLQLERSPLTDYLIMHVYRMTFRDISKDASS